jgi:hypothetical protein
MIRRAFEILKPGGVVIGQLPARDSWEERIAGRYWGGYHYPRHLQAFSYRALAELFRSTGFEEVKVGSAPHVQAALSFQNWLIGKGWRPKLRYGKTSIYSLLILMVLPFEVVAWLAGAGGIMNFFGRKPHA